MNTDAIAKLDQMSDEDLEAGISTLGKVGEPIIPTEPSPAEKPEGAKEEPVKVEPVVEEDDKDIPTLEKGRGPNPNDFENLRGVTKQFKSRAKQAEAEATTLKARIAELEKAPPKAAVVEQVHQDIPNETAFIRLAEARASKFEKPEQNREIEKLALGIIDTMDVTQVMGVLERAKKGEFGEASADITVIARDSLVEAQARELRSRGEREASNEKAQAFQSKVNESLDRVTKNADYKDLLDPKSELAKFTTEWRKANVLDDTNPNAVKQGPMAALLSREDWPERVVQLAHQAFLASQAVKYRKELEQLKQRETVRKTPDAGGSGAPEGGSQGATEDSEFDKDLEERLMAAGKVGDGIVK